MTRTTALVAGAGGIIGNAVAHELMRSDWRVRALGRRSVEGVPSIQADLTDAGATAAALREAADTTHLFYAALAPDPDLATEAARNAAMLGNLLDGLEAAGAPLRPGTANGRVSFPFRSAFRSGPDDRRYLRSPLGRKPSAA
jgi:nucleoside-diphosphate-sugar epimerase